ncbi:MAG TPA: molybdate ABC transporter permease subunit [Tepidisphaeraceae bacterium]|jgi:molybdate transport system permease protein
MNDLWGPLFLSSGIALAATALTALLGVPLAFALSRRHFRGKSLLEAMLTLPLVLPPTVVGYMLIITFGARGWVGMWLERWFGYSILFRFEGAVLASAVVAFPLLYMPAKAAFASVAREFEDTAKVMGASSLQLFWNVSLPMAKRGILSGVTLAFARALGEFGATVMVFGWAPGRLTLPISVYSDYEQGDLGHATGAVVALTALSLALIASYNRSTSGK